MCDATDQEARDQLCALMTLHPEKVQYEALLVKRNGEQLLRLRAVIQGGIMNLTVPAKNIDWPAGYSYGIDGAQGLLDYPDRLARVLTQYCGMFDVHWMLWTVWNIGEDTVSKYRITI